MTEVYVTCKDGKETSELLSSHYSLTTSLSYSSATTLMWGVSSMTAPEMDSEEPGPGTIQELPTKAKAEWAVGRTWGNAVMKGLKFIQGTETGNKVQHMTTGAVQENKVHGYPGGRARGRGGRLALLLHSPGRDCMGRSGGRSLVKLLRSILTCGFPQDPDIPKGNLPELLFPSHPIDTQKMRLLLSYILLVLQNQHWHSQTELPSLSSCLSSGITQRQDTKKKWIKSRKSFWEAATPKPWSLYHHAFFLFGKQNISCCTNCQGVTGFQT